MIPLLTYIIQLFVGVLSILSFRHNMRSRDTITPQELLGRLEERDREIERLKIRLHAHEIRTEHRERQHLHN